jgi:hypothetical protein
MTQHKYIMRVLHAAKVASGGQQARHPYQKFLLVVGFLHKVVGAGAPHGGLKVREVIGC